MQVGVVSGVPMTPDQIRELMNEMNQTEAGAHAARR